MEIDQIKRMFDVVNASSNPNAMIQAMAGSDPRLKTIMSEIRALNGSPKDVFYLKAREKGMTDEQINQFVQQLSAALK